ncbi:SNF2 family N-terminal domain protein [Fusobacterium gonidiaformans 3-1-5R]|uniref:SNF2 family N-terminal domain protein n=1 Tax=Fusobacterium gonidiaformans 3-1-5R TaxID=469605 RepID=E5BEM9_9FUSO|nr:SNF2-related protein [Fusobacterium gonidiaformans]EFS20560.1 SNF2 family N-terminal domain protein [Fusobacterium gonidiaformans 3-1-5R]
MIYEMSKEQLEAIEKLKKLKVGALFMETGTGKTMTALQLFNDRFQANKTNHLIWIAPLNTKDNFWKEVKKYGFENLPITFYGIESIRQSGRIFLEVLNLVKELETSFIVLDESLKIKNYVQVSQRIIKIGRYCKYRLILNGTLISKNFLDLYNQLDFLSPKILNMSFLEFRNRFTDEIIVKKRGRELKRFVSDNANEEALFKMIDNYIYRCELVLNLEREYVKYYYDFFEKEEEYNKIKDRMLDDLERGGFHFLEYAQKLQSIYAVTEDKKKVFEEILKEYPKCIVFCKFVESQEYLKEKYPNILVLSYQKHSFGLNLQEYNVIVFWDKTFDYATVEQAEARIFRIGQTKACTYIRMQCDCGLDKMIAGNICKKGNMLENLKIEFMKQIEERKKASLT